MDPRCGLVALNLAASLLLALLFSYEFLQFVALKCYEGQRREKTRQRWRKTRSSFKAMQALMAAGTRGGKLKALAGAKTPTPTPVRGRRMSYSGSSSSMISALEEAERDRKAQEDERKTQRQPGAPDLAGAGEVF